MKLRIMAILMFLLLAAGCQEQEPDDTIKGKGTFLLTDESGNRYAVTHYSGDYYIVLPIKSALDKR